MRGLKNIIAGIGIILVIGFIALYFMPNSYRVVNSAEIDRPAIAVYAQLYDFNNWAKWDPWVEKDPAAKIIVEGTPGTSGHKMSWDGKKIGIGSLTIKSSSADAKGGFVYSGLEITKPSHFEAKDYIKLEADGDKTKVTWETGGGLPFPMGRLFGLLIDKMIGKNQKKGLNNLKKYVESLPVAPPVAVADSSAKAM